MKSSETLDVVGLVKEILGKTGWDQQTLAREINTKPEVVSRWMTGKHRISKAKLLLLHQVLKKDSQLSQNVHINDTSIQYPFQIKVLRDSLTLKFDDSGNIDLSGIMELGLRRAS